MKHLFVAGEFKSHSGPVLPYKIECDALTDADIACIAAQLARLTEPFGVVDAIPRGGVRLGRAMEQYAIANTNVLVVDDVLTTGASLIERMKKIRAAFGTVGSKVQGAVIFARGKLPPNVVAFCEVNIE